MTRNAVTIVLVCSLLGLGCRSPGVAARPAHAADLPPITVDEALFLARQAAALEYDLTLYTVDACARGPDGWWISFDARRLEEVGTTWSRAQQERWLARGNHFDVLVKHDGSTCLFGGR